MEVRLKIQWWSQITNSESQINPKSKISKLQMREFRLLVIWLLVIIWNLVPGVWNFSKSFAAGNIKEPNVAGAFYPEDSQELTNLIKYYIDGAKGVQVKGTPLVLISPHAGYIYSGPVAGYGFRALSGKNFQTVIILAPSHYFPFHGASVFAEGAFRTPLGDLEIDSVLARELIVKDLKLLFFEPRYFEKEHAVEVELPFLQIALQPGFKILPVLLGDMTYEDCEALATYLVQVIKDKPILVLASTDLSHYRPYEEAIGYDTKTVDFVKNFDAKGLWDAVADTGWNVCGSRAVVTSMLYAKKANADKIDILKVANSGDTAGDKSRVVGYMSALFSRAGKDRSSEVKSGAEEGITKDGEEAMLTKEDKNRLLEIARATIEAHVAGKSIPVFKETSPGLNLKRGVFVTLRKKGELRGCIGIFSSGDPLYKTVSQMSVESSASDFRFSPVEKNELKDIRIEISVLTEPALISDWHKIRLGIDGVIVRRSFSSGVFLPQVATETGWDLETFLGQLCSQKAGLPWDSFKDPATQLYTFQALIFSEKE
jgi:AmmeMemoRadiSam system protein B/AmmeMemoRadiSam system protein A